MNRIEFMTILASLLQDVPAEERREAMKYYNDYFDDAGAENEEQVIRELGSPEKIAATIKEGINGYAGNEGEFTDTGYHEPKFEKQKVPETRDEKANGKAGAYQYSYENKTNEAKKEPWNSKPLKIILIITIAIVAVPIIVPVVLGILAAVAGCILALVAILVALVIAAAAVAITGIVIFGVGVVHLFTEFAVGLALTGAGLIILLLGAIATVAAVKLCIVIVPGIIKGIVWICRKPFQRKAVA